MVFFAVLNVFLPSLSNYYVSVLIVAADKAESSFKPFNRFN